MLRLTKVVGQATDAAIAEQLHRLEHDGRVEWIVLPRDEAARHRLRIATDRGTHCAIALPRNQRLVNGAVLLLEPDRAVVVRLTEEETLELAPRDVAAALELGYFCGNMHWPVRFAGGRIMVILGGPPTAYLERIAHFLADGRVRAIGHD
jgi:urease accessory protein